MCDIAGNRAMHTTNLRRVGGSIMLAGSPSAEDRAWMDAKPVGKELL